MKLDPYSIINVDIFLFSFYCKLTLLKVRIYFDYDRLEYRYDLLIQIANNCFQAHFTYSVLTL